MHIKGTEALFLLEVLAELPTQDSESDELMVVNLMDKMSNLIRDTVNDSVREHAN
tara:strand:- start:3396 stop:3560 length:165 start_codon:yes stop_codon:yes gene_type:complete